MTTDELREQIIQVLAETTWVTFIAEDHRAAVTPAKTCDVADALLAGPVAPLLAKLKAVETLADRWITSPNRSTDNVVAAHAIRRALDKS